MTNITTEGGAFHSDIFSNFPRSVEGTASGLPSINEVGIDEEMRHPYWSAVQAGRVLLGRSDESNLGTASYGYTVYRALRDGPQIPKTVCLDSDRFLPETDLVEVMNQAATFASEFGDNQLIAPIVSGMIETASMSNGAGDQMRGYLDSIVSTGNYDAIREYVDFMNLNLVKTAPETKLFLRRMAHAILQLETSEEYLDDKVTKVEKQVLLEDIGHAWIRRALPVRQIDWLP